MLEFMLCSMLTILPDFLFRRYVQGKRLGEEINLFSIWYELRYGIVSCLMLTITLITLVFFFHPASTAVISYFRTVPVMPEIVGRVAEVHVGLREEVEAGQPLFTLESSVQEAAVQAAERQVEEVEASVVAARSDLAAAQSGVAEARAALKQATDELETQLELRARNADIVSLREIERRQNVVDGRQATLDSTLANLETVRARLEVELPARRASAQAALQQALVALEKTVVRAGVSGRLEQFTTRPGDIVNPMLRPAGILVPTESGRTALEAGFGQIESFVIRPGMIGEVTCAALPLTIIPVTVTQVQGVIAAGQLRPTDVLVDPLTQARQPGGVTVYLEPLYEGGIDRLPPGAQCIANLYTSNHARLQDPDLGFLTRLALHGIDTIGLVHAIILRMQALVLPVRTLVFSGGH